MMRWLRRFFYDDNPVVKLVGALSEPVAEMYRELLADNGIVAMVKNMGALTHLRLPMENDFDLFIRQSDLERAKELLTPVLQTQYDEQEQL